MRLSILTVLFVIFCLGYSNAQVDSNKILIVTSNQHTYGDTNMNASNHFAEIVWAYDVFVKNDYPVDFVSPLGGAIPIGYISTSDSIQKHYLYDNVLMNKLKRTKKPTQIIPDSYRAIYYSGGGAAMFGISENIEIAAIANSIYENNGIISAVCHGTAGITNLKDKLGKPLYEGKQISGYPNLFENMSADYFKTFPFSIEEKIKENKGLFVFSEKRNANFFVIDGRFITGQDPSSTKSVAEKIVDAIRN